MSGHNTTYDNTKCYNKHISTHMSTKSLCTDFICTDLIINVLNSDTLTVNITIINN